MANFREVIENRVYASKQVIINKGTIQLCKKIHAFKRAILAINKFKALGLARSVNDQEQQGVQMICIKLAIGKLMADYITLY
jgi:hypothetical protein